MFINIWNLYALYRVVLDLQVTVEIQDHQEPTDHQDLLVSPETTDEMETRVTQDLEDHLEILWVQKIINGLYLFFRLKNFTELS